jgi:hypothetical protein
MNYQTSIRLVVASFLAGGTALGAAFVRNPSFESNFNETWPHYSAIDDWVGGSGVNDLVLDPGGPFHNAGTPVPDRARVGFKQQDGDVSQEIFGLEPGATYWLQFFYDGRLGGGSAQSVVVSFNLAFPARKLRTPAILRGFNRFSYFTVMATAFPSSKSRMRW